MQSRLGLIFTLLRQGESPSSILVKLLIRDALVGCESLLDVGCGTSKLARQIGIKYTVGIEGDKPTFEKAVQLKTHDKLVLGVYAIYWIISDRENSMRAWLWM